MDKAAVLAYCRVKDKQGKWVGCECCFTIVYDVMIVCTSIYMKGTNSESEYEWSRRREDQALTLRQGELWKHLSYGAYSLHRHGILGITCCRTYHRSSPTLRNSRNTNLELRFS